MQKPSISIGMPVYNGAKYIRDALDSLLNQSYQNFELTISDNASTDNTEDICKEYMALDSRITYIRQSKNIGAPPNFSFLLDNAKANIFMWAAYDDLWSVDYLEKGVKELEDPNVNFVFPVFKLQSIYLKISKKMNGKVFNFIEFEDRKKRVLEYLSLHHYAHHANIVYSLFRTQFLKTAYSKQDISSDGGLGLVVLGLGRGKLLDGGLFSKRYPKLWPGPISSFFRKKNFVEFELAKETAIKKINVLFPEYIEEVKVIFNQYKAYSHDKNFKICSVNRNL